MKTVIKVLSILGIILSTIVLIILIATQGAVSNFIKEEYEAGRLIVNGVRATQEEYEALQAAIPVLYGVLYVILGFNIIFELIILFVASKEKYVACLVLGILSLLVGNIIMGILLIVYYAIGGKNNSIRYENKSTF